MSKPTLGYPSRTAAVAALRQQGLATAAIAIRIGIGVGAVAALEVSARRYRRSSPQRTVLFPIELLDRLQPHAAKRNLSANELARLIVEYAVEDDLVDAIMDDGAAP